MYIQAMRMLAAAALVTMLAGCTFYIGGKDAGTREGEESAMLNVVSAANRV